jgi:cyclopropane fatty-acyl-phospholipid synthase-like methyltransferase
MKVGNKTDMGKEFKNKDVAFYYDYTRLFYRVFWHGKTNAIHYGFHDETTKSPEQELLRMIEKTAQAGSIKEDEMVADLGCGIGGSAFWIAQNCCAQVCGITLSSSQYQKAIRIRKKLGLEKRTGFKVGDYFCTEYEDAHFDVVFGLESLCYGQHRVKELAQEMYRISKPGGRIVVTDGFLGKDLLSENESRDVDTFCKGFLINKMITPEKFIEALTEVGFRDVTYADWTMQVLPTADRMHTLTRKWHWFIVLVTALRLIPDVILKNNKTGIIQKKLFTERTLVYGCITAKK